MTKAKIRTIEAAIEAARKQRLPFVEVTEEGITVRIPLVPDNPAANDNRSGL
jgi:hypothetical protein